jgi:hypothetical protein
MLHIHNLYESGGGVGPRVDSLTVSELDDIWAVTSRYIDTERLDFEAQLRTLPEVGLWQVRDGSLVGLGQPPCLPGRAASAGLRPSSLPRAGIAAFLDQLAQQHYGANRRPQTGVAIRSGQKRLLPTAAPLDAAALSAPDVRFFDQVNRRTS